MSSSMIIVRIFITMMMMLFAQGMMEFVENSDKALAALEKRDAAKQQSNEVKHDNDDFCC